MLNVAGVEIVERNNCLIISAFFFTTTACLAVCLRLLTRAVLVRNFGLDDYLITAAMFGTIGFLVAVIQLKGVNIAIWSGLEINVAIICASVPALKPLFVKFFPQMISFLGDSAKRSRTRRSAQNSAHHRSDHHNTHQSGDHDDKPCPIEIQVQSFEMRAVATERDDDSQKNLVPKHGPVWTA
ncbi:hypothetical protein HIM_09023 [Hirsutella minnesotensis 3608]|uniref:Uncharacterized protein n=1 Tax=Hirsutella minnesotensis 3608 TaxID=1043627 RepID=A0A0F8A3B8_9HYPO|nr:hypothetical protein HIM_09023 [Hirsutella minnesotensis 3608]